MLSPLDSSCELSYPHRAVNKQVPVFLQVKLLSLSVVTCSSQTTHQSIPPPFDTPATATACAASSPLLVCCHLLPSQTGRELIKSAPSFVYTSNLRFGERG